jgi:hypothetical protein
MKQERECGDAQDHSVYEVPIAEVYQVLDQAGFRPSDQGQDRWEAYPLCRVELETKDEPRSVAIFAFRKSLATNATEFVFPNGADWRQFIGTVCEFPDWGTLPQPAYATSPEGWYISQSGDAKVKNERAEARRRSLYRVTEEDIWAALEAAGAERGDKASLSTVHLTPECSVDVAEDTSFGALEISATRDVGESRDLEFVYPNGADWREFISAVCR